MNGNPRIEPQLGPDFAARVLEAADRVLARRRRLRRAAGAAALFAGVAATVFWLDVSAVPQAPARGPMLAAAPPAQYEETRAPAVEQNTSPNALSWLFPDAEPLTRYAAEDATDDSNGSAGALLADDD